VNTSRPWARHYQDEWHRRAGDPRLPYWLRVAALAYGSHVDNGHANYKRGQIALVLGKPGEPYDRVGRAISDAIEYGWLNPGSWWGCLIVPERAIRKGPWMTPKPCRRCAERFPNHLAEVVTLRPDPPLNGGFGVRSSPSDGGSAARSRH